MWEELAWPVRPMVPDKRYPGFDRTRTGVSLHRQDGPPPVLQAHGSFQAMRRRPALHVQPPETPYSSIRETHDGAGRFRSGSAARRCATAAVAA